MRVGFLGTGRIAAALVDALAPAGHRIELTRRGRATSAALAERHPQVGVHDDPQAVVDRSEVVFLCLMAATAWELLPRLRFRPEQEVINVMCDAPLPRLRQAVAPAGRVCSTIPMPFVRQGGCPLPVHPESRALEALLGADNEIIVVASEAAMTPHWAVAGTVAGMLTQLQSIADWLGPKTGDPAGAERYVAALYGGYLGALPKDGRGRLLEARSELATPGGLNQQFREAVEMAAMPEALQAGLDALDRRARGN